MLLRATVMTTALATLLAGCSGEVSIGTSKDISGSDIARDLTEEYNTREKESGITMTSLTCEEVKARVGATIRCAGRNSKDIELELGGEITSTSGGGADYRWRTTKAFAPGTFFAASLRPQIEEKLGNPIREVRCPTRVQLGKGRTFRCEVDVTTTRSGVATLEQTDASGSYRWRLGDAPAAATQ